MLRFHVGTRRYFIHDPATAALKAGMNEIGPAGIGRKSELAVLPDPCCASSTPLRRTGNKRLGWLATVAFLWINGQILVAPEDDAYDLVISVADRRISVTESAAALASWARPRTPG